MLLLDIVTNAVGNGRCPGSRGAAKPAISATPICAFASIFPAMMRRLPADAGIDALTRFRKKPREIFANFSRLPGVLLLPGRKERARGCRARTVKSSLGISGGRWGGGRF